MGNVAVHTRQQRLCHQTASLEGDPLRMSRGAVVRSKVGFCRAPL